MQPRPPGWTPSSGWRQEPCRRPHLPPMGPAKRGLASASQKSQAQLLISPVANGGDVPGRGPLLPGVRAADWCAWSAWMLACMLACMALSCVSLGAATTKIWPLLGADEHHVPHARVGHPFALAAPRHTCAACPHRSVTPVRTATASLLLSSSSRSAARPPALLAQPPPPPPPPPPFSAWSGSTNKVPGQQLRWPRNCDGHFCGDQRSNCRDWGLGCSSPRR
ncbi:hypothetical protein BS50DRAFT_43877 [Corynespora cassiicola Philippines]|uniref:Uncharacterized protein n=1 Tax=Corynespora cassiicola Philippines TaxID=1448308 RepID=A0A2T2PDA9_CORCC|nr:hypothetical protein BS50DRAFT_43877 [Corynespora cassiicola Philippines]